MNYSIVIATRNRIEALRLSIPRMLEQSRPASELIVVDSSDVHEPVAELIKQQTAGHPIRVHIVQSKRGLTLQRNIGLGLVTEPLVFFPDDDSIWYPGVASEILEVYENDSEHLIAAVCAAEAKSPPSNFDTGHAEYKMTVRDRINQRLLRVRTVIEHRLFPDPGRILGRSFFASFPLPEWATSRNVVSVEWMAGFRMTFRTKVVRQFGFDTNLQRYSLFEDRDASFAAWKHGAVVAALRAKVFHYRSPERRDGGLRLGTEQLLNMAYIVTKHTPIDHRSRNYLRRFGYYKCLLYLLACYSRYGRERLEGAWTAIGNLRPFLTTPPSSAAKAYFHALSHCRAPRPNP